MGPNKLHCLLFFVFFGLVTSSTGSVDECLLEDQDDIGNCKYLRDCPELLAKLTNPNNTIIYNLERLKHSWCGAAKKNPLLYCCPDPGVSLKNKQLNYEQLPSDCGRVKTNRVQSGGWSDLDEFPWMTLLEFHDKETAKIWLGCPSVLIHRRYILTSGHCVDRSRRPGMWKLVNVRLGEFNTSSNPDCLLDGSGAKVCADEPVSIPVQEVIVHVGYDHSSLDQAYDVALLRLRRDAPFTKYIQPVCLPRSDDLASEFQVAGWSDGLPNENSGDWMAKYKRKATLLANETRCQDNYKNERYVQLGVGQFCAEWDWKMWNSGGPLIQLEQDSLRNGSHWVIAGLVNFGSRGYCDLQPGVFTKVHNHMPWILSKINSIVLKP